jgi:HPt (histidine-containing phosphotransfer) domain-containing protein
MNSCRQIELFHSYDETSDEIPVNEHINQPQNNDISFEDGLKRVNGNTKLFSEIIEFFLKEHINDYDLIKKYLQDGNYKQAKSTIHTLKGVSLNIGAYKLANELKKLENNLKILQSDYIINKLQPMKLELSTLKKYILEYLDKQNSR